jgi:hypothetical protein
MLARFVAMGACPDPDAVQAMRAGIHLYIRVERMMRTKTGKRMRTKNPFCTATQLVVLQTIKAHPGKRVGVMAREARLSASIFSHALVQLLTQGHIEKDYGHYLVTVTGSCLIDCANRIARTRGGKR